MLRGGELQWPDTCAPGLSAVDALCAWPQVIPTGSSTAATSNCSLKQEHAVQFRTLTGQTCAFAAAPQTQPSPGAPANSGAADCARGDAAALQSQTLQDSA